jgi:hypothetical protein
VLLWQGDEAALALAFALPLVQLASCRIKDDSLWLSSYRTPWICICVFPRTWRCVRTKTYVFYETISNLKDFPYLQAYWYPHGLAYLPNAILELIRVLSTYRFRIRCLQPKASGQLEEVINIYKKMNSLLFKKSHDEHLLPSSSI